MQLDGALEDSISSSLLDAVDDARTAKRLVRMFDLPERVVQVRTAPQLCYYMPMKMCESM